jgi:hypothetical protein
MMAMRLDKSGELTMMHGIRDELDDQKEWNTRRSRLRVFLFSVVAVMAAVFVAPHLPGWEMISNAFKSVMAAIW